MATDQPRHDRYGDPLPVGVVVRLGSLRFRAPSEIESMALAPNGKVLAVSFQDGLMLMDAHDGKRGKHLPTAGPNMPSESLLAFSPDSKRLIGWGPRIDQQRLSYGVHVWELAGAGPPREYEIEKVIWLGWSRDGQPLAIRDDNRALHLHELTSGKSRRFAYKRPGIVPPFACAPAGGALALADEPNMVHVWDIATGRERCTIRHQASIESLIFSPDGRTLAARIDKQDGAKNEVQLWDAATGKLRATMRTKQKDLVALAFSADGKTLATSSDEDVRFWDAATGRERGRLKGEGIATEHLAFTSDGRTLVATERNSAAIHLWDVGSGERKSAQVRHRRRARAVFAPDGQRLASWSEWGDTIRLWNAANAEPLAVLHRPGQWVRDIAFAADGRSFYSAWNDENLWVSDAATGERRHTIALEDPKRPDTRQGAVRVYCSEDGKTLIVLSYYYPTKKGGRLPYQEMLITGWDGATRKQRFHRRRPGWDAHVVPSANARVLAAIYPPMNWEHVVAAQSSGRPLKLSIRLEDAATGAPLLTFPVQEGEIRPLAFSHDGRLFASHHSIIENTDKGSERKSVLQVWETAAAAMVLTVPSARSDQAAFSRDGRLLALVSPEREILVWDLRQGRERRRFKGFDANVIGLNFSPDGRRLVSGLSDSTLLIWDVGPRDVETSKLGADAAAKAWTDLAGTDAARAFRARGMLASTPAEAIPFLKRYLHPVSPADPKRLAQLLSDLESETFAVREKAQRELAQLGDLAEPTLRRTLDGKPSLEMRRRVQKLLDRLRGPVKQPEMLRSLRAIAVLEDIGTPAVRQLLEDMAKGADGARITREAKEARRRLRIGEK